MRDVVFTCEECPFQLWNDGQVADLYEQDAHETEIDKAIIFAMEAQAVCGVPDIRRIGFFGRQILRCASPLVEKYDDKYVQLPLRQAVREKQLRDDA